MVELGPQLSRWTHARRRFGLAISILSAILLIWAFLTGVSSVLANRESQVPSVWCVAPGGAGECQSTIGAALAMANPGDTIRVAAGVYTENVVISKTVTLEGGWNPAFSLRDTDAFSVTIRPLDQTQSVVSVLGADPTVDGFVVTGGRAELGSNHGGGMRLVDSNAIIRNNVVISNSAFYLGGGIWVQRGAPTLEDNRIEGNSTLGLGQEGYGGGVQLENAQATLTRNIVISNTIDGTSGFGAGVDVIGGIALFASNFISHNDALGIGYGGGIAVHSAAAYLYGDHIAGNLVDYGGGIYVISGTLSVDAAVLRSNRASRSIPGQGGGVYALDSSVNISNTVIGGNLTANGGGIYNSHSALSLYQTTVISNSAVFDGGGVSSDGQVVLNAVAVISNTAGSDGGGILNAGGGQVFIAYSTLSNNSAMDGGGLYQVGGNTTISSTTVSGNTAGNEGGGVLNLAASPYSGIITVTNATVADNAAALGDGIANLDAVTIRNSIVAGNGDSNCEFGLFSTGYNVEDTSTCGFGQSTDQPNTQPLLEPLGGVGGASLYHALASTSPAIDAGDNAMCPLYDQRGIARPVDGDGDGVAICDIGAVEYEPLFSLYLPLVLK